MKRTFFFLTALFLMLLPGCGGGGGTTNGYLFSPFAGEYEGKLDCTITGSPSHQTTIQKFDFVADFRLTQAGWIVVSSRVVHRPTGEFREGVFTRVDFDSDRGPNHIIYFEFELLDLPGRISSHGIDRINQNTDVSQDPNVPGLVLEDGTYDGPITGDLIGNEYGTGPNFPQGSGGSAPGDYRLEMQRVRT